MCADQIRVKPVNPLWMPPGSIRAILALTIVGIVIYQILIGDGVGLLLSETLSIVLTHYFASRRSVTLPPELLNSPEIRELLEQESNPLWLPRGSVRLIMLVAFIATAIILLIKGQLFSPNVVGTIALIFAYLGGVLIRWLRSNKNAVPKPTRYPILVHLTGLLVLFACFIMVLLTLGSAGDANVGLPGWLEQFLLSFILYYFGSR
ncbi:MAG: hypothetical protein R3E08_11130 [Thiotrichaceae bacterium]